MWVYQGGGLWDGVLFAACMGMIFGLVHALFTVHLGLSQHVTGIGITMAAASLSYFVYRMLLPDATTPPKIEPFKAVPIPFLSDLPIIGEALFTQSPLTYLAFLTVPTVGYVLFRTPLGLAVRMAGENPVAVEAQGLNVLAIRTGAVMVGSGLMAIGGAFITMSWFDAFYFNMINGRRLDLRGAGHLRLLASRQGPSWRAYLCRPGSPPGPRPADGRGRHPLPVLSDAALPALDPGDDRHGQASPIPESPPRPLPPRRPAFSGVATSLTRTVRAESDGMRPSFRSR